MAAHPGERQLPAGTSHVQLARTEGRVAWCVGFSDDPAQADMLFDAVVRTLRILTTGESDSADWAEIPDGEWLD